MDSTVSSFASKGIQLRKMEREIHQNEREEEAGLLSPQPTRKNKILDQGRMNVTHTPL